MSGRLHGAKVLLVDDDEDILESMDEALRSEGAETVLAANGNDAVASAAEHTFDLVVLDMMLPGRSGFLVLEKIKGNADSPPVIMLTANEGKRHQAYAENLGVDQYLLKPVPLERLISVAETLLTSTASQADASARKRKN